MVEGTYLSAQNEEKEFKLHQESVRTSSLREIKFISDDYLALMLEKTVHAQMGFDLQCTPLN